MTDAESNVYEALNKLKAAMQQATPEELSSVSVDYVRGIFGMFPPDPNAKQRFAELLRAEMDKDDQDHAPRYNSSD